ncbi:MAG TPA: hypothetical protein VGX25_33255 [Actinophytocola sp.]|uniref:hypothetical protein n=1 Tax=Actinophytocola sp. TaxID=1872138 RepID=UPI002DDCBE89|nr:hypothetical protein [Actinophytocola sp.]HEV2784280.1 hypothetical protein [Actinophytocola sp.]
MLHGALQSTVFGSVDANVFAAWGQVIGAAGTLLAVIVAIWIAIRDGRYRDAERRDNEAVHARLLSAIRVSDPPNLTIGFTNYGSCPVHSVRLTGIVGHFGDVRSVGWSINGSSDSYVLAAIAPGQTATTPPITITWPENATVDEAAALYYPTIVFYDTNGRWWERTAHDPPKRLLTPPPKVSQLPTRTTPDRNPTRVPD